jgi:hypothetical protein
MQALRQWRIPAFQWTVSVPCLRGIVCSGSVSQRRLHVHHHRHVHYVPSQLFPGRGRRMDGLQSMYE